MAIARIAAIAARRIVPGIAEMVIQRIIDHHLGQLAQQATRAGPLGKLAQRLLISRRQLRAVLAPIARYVSHWCLLLSQELHYLELQSPVDRWP